MTEPPGEHLVHGTCIAIGVAAILIRGNPGSGKSDLALRIIDQPGYGLGDHLLRGHLVADDQVMLRRDGDFVLASAPPAIAGKIELRGLGIMNLDSVENVPLRLVVDLKPRNGIERLPEPETLAVTLMGLQLPRIWLDPFTASAPALLRAALSRFAPWATPGGVF